MPAKTTQKIIVLFDDEIRIAAKACAAYRDLEETATDEEYRAALTALLHACVNGLAGAEDEAATILLGAKPAPRRTK